MRQVYSFDQLVRLDIDLGKLCINAVYLVGPGSVENMITSKFSYSSITNSSLSRSSVSMPIW